jgi:hypothetical protein
MLLEYFTILWRYIAFLECHGLRWLCALALICLGEIVPYRMLTVISLVDGRLLALKLVLVLWFLRW